MQPDGAVVRVADESALIGACGERVRQRRRDERARSRSRRENRDGDDDPRQLHWKA